MKTYDINDISYKYFKEYHIMASRPCVIRGFVNDENCPRDNFLHKIPEEELVKYNIGSYPAYMSKYISLCSNKLVSGIEKDESLELQQQFRLWKHNKGVFTAWHYDGNGADLFNVSLKGSKDFYLAPPNSLPVWPLSNVVVAYPFKESIRIRLLPGEMLYIPAYWFHKVITLEDDTLNMNYIFFNKNQEALPISLARNKQLFTLHSIFKTHMCDDPICKIMVDGRDNVAYAFARGMIETLPFLILFVIVLYCFSPRSLVRLLWVGAVGTFLILCIFMKYLNTISFGISRIAAVFIIVWLVIFQLLVGI